MAGRIMCPCCTERVAEISLNCPKCQFNMTASSFRLGTREKFESMEARVEDLPPGWQKFYLSFLDSMSQVLYKLIFLITNRKNNLDPVDKDRDFAGLENLETLLNNEDESTNYQSAMHHSASKTIPDSSCKASPVKLQRAFSEQQMPHYGVVQRSHQKESEMLQRSHSCSEIYPARVEKESFLTMENANAWVKLMVNSVLILIILISFIMIVLTIREDVFKKISDAHKKVDLDIERCVQEYTTNKCVRDLRVPAMEDKCLEWEKCMNQDAMQVVKSSMMSAALIAEIMNSFVDPLSYKTIGFVLTTLFGFIVFWNCSLRGGSTVRTPLALKKE